jgi:capsular polysaccharide biosynthesis protein
VAENNPQNPTVKPAIEPESASRPGVILDYAPQQPSRRRRSRLLPLLCIVAGAVLGGVIANTLCPPYYTCSAIIQFDSFSSQSNQSNQTIQQSHVSALTNPDFIAAVLKGLIHPPSSSIAHQNLHVLPIPSSNVIFIAYTSLDPREAAMIVNAVANRYIASPGTSGQVKLLASAMPPFQARPRTFPPIFFGILGGFGGWALFAMFSAFPHRRRHS